MGDFAWVGHKLAKFGRREPAGGGDLDRIDGDFSVARDGASENTNKAVNYPTLILLCASELANKS